MRCFFLQEMFAKRMVGFCRLRRHWGEETLLGVRYEALPLPGPSSTSKIVVSRRGVFCIYQVTYEDGDCADATFRWVKVDIFFCGFFSKPAVLEGCHTSFLDALSTPYLAGRRRRPLSGSNLGRACCMLRSRLYGFVFAPV